MQGDELIEQLRLDELQTRLEQFQTHHQNHGATNHQHRDGEDQVHQADVLVIRGLNPAQHATLVMRRAM